MPLLRIRHCPNLNVWDKKQAPDIASEWFDMTDPEQSLFEADSPFEEAENAAAWSLTNIAKRESCYVLRILPIDLAVASITPNNPIPGGTGVVAVDFRHWNAPASRDQLIRLISHILGRVRNGEDALRWIGIRQQELHWQRFRDAARHFVVEEARRSGWKLDGNKSPRRTHEDQLRREFWESPPAIPCHRIRLIAWLNYQNRCRSGIGGTPEDDWLKAEKGLRDDYLMQLVGYKPPPPGFVDD